MDIDDLFEKTLKGALKGGLKKKTAKKLAATGGTGILTMLTMMAGAKSVQRQDSSGEVPLPPPMPSQPLPPPAPPEPSSGSASQGTGSAGMVSPSEKRSLLLLRAMVAAANADHHIDEEERRRIFSKAEFHGLSSEEQRFLDREFDRPTSISGLVRAVQGDHALARQVYIVSLLAVDLDTDAERFYFQQLAEALGLSEADVRELHARAEL